MMPTGSNSPQAYAYCSITRTIHKGHVAYSKQCCYVHFVLLFLQLLFFSKTFLDKSIDTYNNNHDVDSFI